MAPPTVRWFAAGLVLALALSGCSKADKALTDEDARVFATTYIKDLNAGDERALADLLNNPTAAKDARDRLDNAAPGSWKLVSTTVEPLTETVYKVELKVTSGKSQRVWPIWLSAEDGRFVVAPLLDSTNKTGAITDPPT